MKRDSNKCGTVWTSFIVANILLVLASACIPQQPCTRQPCTTTEIRSRLAEKKIPWSIYTPKSDSIYSALIPTYLYVDLDEKRLVTYFGSSQQGTRVAEMLTSWFLEGMDGGALTHSQSVVVDWADESQARTFALIPGNFYDNVPPGPPYQTGVLWKKDGLWFHFYSTLPLGETLVLINSLEEIKP